MIAISWSQSMRLALLLFSVCPFSAAQVCRLSVAGLNQDRHVKGDIHAECPGDFVHTAPFGNWGVTSNFGHKGDSHQFDGWCHNTRVCDNAGACRIVCTDGWYEWNSCTDDALYKPPNCSLFNAAGCSEQVSTTGIDVHGTRYVDLPVSCPRDTNGDGILDQGGCRDISLYTTETNFLSLYELDPVCCDQLVQTVYYPQLTIPLSCDAFGCAAAFSEWVSPASWDSPASPAKVTAQLAVLVNWGGFVDPIGACRFSVPAGNVVSAASFTGPNVAPDSIATVLGDQLAPATAQAATLPLPVSLDGFSMQVTDARGTARAAPLFYISPRQVNFLIPSGTAPGTATLSAYSGTVLRSTARMQIESIAPALFTQNSDGKGVAAAIAVRVSADGAATPGFVFTCGAAPGSCVPAPIDLGAATDNTWLILFGTGIRSRSTLTAVSVQVGGVHGRVDFAGAQGQYVGLDQINVLLPHELAGHGTVDVALTVDGKPANTVQIAIR